MQGHSEEKRKQNCETKALKRLARKIKEAFPRLPIILLAGSLYASEPVMDPYLDNGCWEFIIHYKTGSILRIMEEYGKILEKGTEIYAEFINDIDYNGNRSICCGSGKKRL